MGGPLSPTGLQTKGSLQTFKEEEMKDLSDTIAHEMSGPSYIQSTEWLDQPTGEGWYWYYDKSCKIFEPINVVQHGDQLLAQESESLYSQLASKLQGQWLPLKKPNPPQDSVSE